MVEQAAIDMKDRGLAINVIRLKNSLVKQLSQLCLGNGRRIESDHGERMRSKCKESGRNYSFSLHVLLLSESLFARALLRLISLFLVEQMAIGKVKCISFNAYRLLNPIDDNKILTETNMQICQMLLHDVNLPFHHVPKVLYWIGLRSSDCGYHWSTVNSLACSRNQFELN